ncbi:hypothetical protein [Nannocystis bainbridge]|uniref:LysM domain-containing protein n=1 Tax=Nannocystis bainbridge TaxID=2995303 RepID=A0ABT5E2B8_9BACT|nr:hypothetical protein [Nannocystis bainbridge]MDC0719925.1 hypothetical protein [Nannocystis bainbridge]
MAAEQAACASAVADKPETEGGASRNGAPLDTWLTWVAFVRAYGRAPSTPADSARVMILLACVRERLLAEQPKITAKPTPGAYYQIKTGDTLFEVTKAAYPGGVSLNGKPPTNMQAAQAVNASPENLRFVRMVAAEKNLFPSGRVTFMPIFGTFAQQRADATKGSEGAGKNYAVIWIPTPPGV